MKSNLVDALRRANEDKSGTNLSDSGSFDATEQDFTVPANQDIADAGFREDAEELEFMSTTRSLAVNDVPAEFGDPMASATVLLTGSDCVIPDSRSLPSMPRLARHVPALCVALALIAGVGWQAYQLLEFRQNTSALGAFPLASQSGGQQEELVSADKPGIRFRYLNRPLPVSEDEAVR